MKLKKMIVLVLFLLLFSGCSGKYEIEIYKNKVNESTYYFYNKDELINSTPYDKTLEISLKYDDNGDFLSYDTKKEVTSSNQKGIRLTLNYSTVDDYKNNSYFLNSCYFATNFTNYDDYITIKTSNEFTCLNEIEEIDKIDIVVKTNHKVKEHNADKKKGNSYIWHITRDNYKNVPINIQMYKNKYVWNYNNEVFKRLGLIILIVGGTLLLIFIVYKFFVYKDKKSNRI